MNSVITTSGITTIISSLQREKKCSKLNQKYLNIEIESWQSTLPQHKSHWQAQWTGILSHRQFKQSEASVSVHSTICFKIMHWFIISKQ